MPAIALQAAAVGAKPLFKALGWLGRGIGKLGRSPLFIDTVSGALAGGKSAAATSLGGNTGNTQRVGKGGPGDASASTGYSSEGGNKNLLLYVGGLVAVLLLMKK